MSAETQAAIRDLMQTRLRLMAKLQLQLAGASQDNRPLFDHFVGSAGLMIEAADMLKGAK